MPDTNPGKVYPHCKLTKSGRCLAMNSWGWAQYIHKQERDAALRGDYPSAQEYKNAAEEVEASIKYCPNCPLRVK